MNRTLARELPGYSKVRAEVARNRRCLKEKLQKKTVIPVQTNFYKSPVGTRTSWMSGVY